MPTPFHFRCCPVVLLSLVIWGGHFPCLVRADGVPGLAPVMGPRLQALHQPGDRVQLSWPTQPGRSYFVWSALVVDGPWGLDALQPVSTVATSTSMQLSLPIPASARFFRVEERAGIENPPDAVALAGRMVEGATPAEVTAAAGEAMAAGGVAVVDGDQVFYPARAPVASWSMDPELLVNLAMEAHARAVSGRFTLEDLGRMWQDMEFPFLGEGSPGDQLLAFLRGGVEDARLQPEAPGSFTFLFVEAMVARQEPSVALMDPLTEPGRVRLTLMEIELLMAAFDRTFPEPETGVPEGRSLHDSLAGGDFCADFKKFLGTFGSKAMQSALGRVQGVLTVKALGGLGMSASEIAQFKSYQPYFRALNMAMKIIKLLQLYASTEVALSVEGETKVHKPHKDEARKLVPVVARAGIPEDAWQEYQKNSGSQAARDVKGCLGFMGMPLPSDLKEIAGKADTWRVAWDVIRGSPEHVVIPSDVNTFDAPSAGHPFAMKLVREGPAGAKATLKLDVKEESELATLFDGPLETATITVKAKVFTAEPPSLELLTRITSLLGTLSALVDLSAGWIQTMTPPSSTLDFEVEYHSLPISLEASLEFDMRMYLTYFAGEDPPMEFTTRGSWNALLTHVTIPLGNDVVLDEFRGDGAFRYTQATSKLLGPGQCLSKIDVAVHDGFLRGTAKPAFNMRGQYLPDESAMFILTAPEPLMAPEETETFTNPCHPEWPPLVLPSLSRYALTGINTLNSMEEGIVREGGKIPGNPLNTWTQEPDRTLTRTFTGAKTVQVILGDGVTALNQVLSQNNVLRLKPVFPAP